MRSSSHRCQAEGNAPDPTQAPRRVGTQASVTCPLLEACPGQSWPENPSTMEALPTDPGRLCTTRGCDQNHLLSREDHPRPTGEVEAQGG